MIAPCAINSYPVGFVSKHIARFESLDIITGKSVQLKCRNGDCGHNNYKAEECVQCYKINICLQPAPGIQILGSVKIIKDWGNRKLPPSPKKKHKQKRPAQKKQLPTQHQLPTPTLF